MLFPGDPDAEDVPAAAADHPLRDIHALPEGVEDFLRPAGGRDADERHLDLVLEGRRKPGEPQLPSLAVEIALLLQAQDVLEDSRGVGDAQEPPELPDGRGKPALEDEALDGLEGLPLALGQLLPYLVYHFVHHI